MSQTRRLFVTTAVRISNPKLRNGNTEGPKKCIHTVPLPFSLTFLPFDKVALAFM
jgi:hypothetical protein